MSVPVSSTVVSSPRADDAHLGRDSDDREIVASIPIKVPLPTLPHSIATHASDPEAPTLVPPTPDAELLAAFVRHRDPEAFTQIVQRYSQMVYRVAMRTVADRHLADDVFQATFLVLSQSARKIKSGEVLAAWLHGTARNLARRALTHKHMQRQHLAQVAILTRAEKGGEMTTSTEIDPLDELVRRHEQQLLDEELQQLPEASRAPLVLYYLEEKSQAEIAQLMGLSVEAVEGRLRRAKQELRLRLIRRGVTLSTVIAAATLLVPSIAFAAPSSTLVSATLISALGGTAASNLLTTGATTAAKLAAQEVAAMSVAGKASAFILATTVSTTLAVGVGFVAFVNSMAGGAAPVEQVAGESLRGYEEGALTIEGFAREIPEPVLIAQAEADEPASPAENAEPSPDPVDPEADRTKAVVYQIADLNEEQRKAAMEFAETLSDSVTRHEKTNSLVIRATAENHRRLGDYLSNQRVKLNGEEREKLVIQQAAEILKWQQSYRAEQVEKEQVRDEMARLFKEHNDRIRRLNEVVDHQRKQLEDLQSLSFDVPDGKVTAIDASNGTVWLNIGRTDGLRAQVTFSVYAKSTTGLARLSKDVKAKIEVVEVNETSSVARIVEADPDHPIEIGDLIFSPAWTAGVREYFALVGDGDLNSDGERDAKDRKILKDLLVNAQAEIDIEITHEGLRVPVEGQLTAQTKWLIVGDLGDPTNAAAMGRPPAEIQRILTVQSQHEMLVQEAVEGGIRVVSLKDFLTYLGWKPESRVLIPPGANAPFQLKAGAISAEINQYLTQWEDKNKSITSLESSITRIEFDTVFHTETRSMGKFYLEQPNRWRVDFEPADEGLLTKPARVGADGKPFKVSAGTASKWICSGQELYILDIKNKSYDLIKIPPQMQENNSSQRLPYWISGPLPALFFMTAQDAKQQFELRFGQLHNPLGNKLGANGKPLRKALHLVATPLDPNVAKEYAEVEVILDVDTFLPLNLRMIDPARNKETVYSFNQADIKVVPQWEKSPFTVDLPGWHLMHSTQYPIEFSSLSSILRGMFSPGANAPFQPKAGAVGAVANAEQIAIEMAFIEVDVQHIGQLADKSDTGLTPKPSFRKVLNSMTKAGTARCLTEPSLVTHLGIASHFISGGEFPIPSVPSSTSKEDVQQRVQEYGTKVDLTPHKREADGRLLLEYSFEISSINANHAENVEGNLIHNVAGMVSRGFTKLSTDGKVGVLLGPITTSAKTENDEPTRNVSTYLWIRARTVVQASEQPQAVKGVQAEQAPDAADGENIATPESEALPLPPVKLQLMQFLATAKQIEQLATHTESNRYQPKANFAQAYSTLKNQEQNTTAFGRTFLIPMGQSISWSTSLEGHMPNTISRQPVSTERNLNRQPGVEVGINLKARNADESLQVEIVLDEVKAVTGQEIVGQPLVNQRVSSTIRLPAGEAGVIVKLVLDDETASGAMDLSQRQGYFWIREVPVPSMKFDSGPWNVAPHVTDEPYEFTTPPPPWIELSAPQPQARSEARLMNELGRKTSDALARPMDIEVKDMPLEAFFTSLREDRGVIVSGGDEGFESSIRVSISARGCTWREVLNALAPEIHPDARFSDWDEVVTLYRVTKSNKIVLSTAYDLSRTTKTPEEVDKFASEFAKANPDVEFQISRLQNILVVKSTLYGRVQIEDFLHQAVEGTTGPSSPKPVIRVTRKLAHPDEVPSK